MIKIDLPVEFNSKQIKGLVESRFPDVKFKIKPARMIIKGSGDNAKIEGAELHLKMNIGSPSELARIDTELKQAIFDLPPEKTDAEEKQEEYLKELLNGPAFVYILNEIDDLKKEIKKLKKETTKGDKSNEPIPESTPEPREEPEFIPSERAKQ